MGSKSHQKKSGGLINCQFSLDQVRAVLNSKELAILFKIELGDKDQLFTWNKLSGIDIWIINESIREETS